jgi:hypothetical protein
MSAVAKAIILFTLAQLFAWFQLNSQYIWEWWRGKAFISALTWGAARFIGSSVGIVIFPILTYALLGESMFTTKTMICFSLALLVVIIQIFF